MSSLPHSHTHDHGHGLHGHGHAHHHAHRHDHGRPSAAAPLAQVRDVGSLLLVGVMPRLGLAAGAVALLAAVTGWALA